MIEYPKFLYHKEKGKILIKSVEEEKELGQGWKDTPAAFLKQDEAKETVLEEKEEKKEAEVWSEPPKKKFKKKDK